MVGFCDLVGTGIAPVLTKTAVKEAVTAPLDASLSKYG